MTNQATPEGETTRDKVGLPSGESPSEYELEPSFFDTLRELKLPATVIATIASAALAGIRLRENHSLDRLFTESPRTEGTSPATIIPRVDSTATAVQVVADPMSVGESASNLVEPHSPHIAPATEIEDEQPPILQYEGRTNPFTPDVQQVVDKLKETYGISIISPERWSFGDTEEPNLPWNPYEIGIVAEAVSQMPPEYIHNNRRAPKEILLLRQPGTHNEGSGGGYSSQRIVLYTSEDFAPDTEFVGEEARGLYRTQGTKLRADVAHEGTHSYVDGKPEILEDWASSTSWVRDGDRWINNDPTTLIHDGGADTSPWEDIAVSAGLMLVNPDRLSKERRDFFLKRPDYGNWSPVVYYQPH